MNRSQFVTYYSIGKNRMIQSMYGMDVYTYKYFKKQMAPIPDIGHKQLKCPNKIECL